MTAQRALAWKRGPVRFTYPDGTKLVAERKFERMEKQFPEHAEQRARKPRRRYGEAIPPGLVATAELLHAIESRFGRFSAPTLSRLAARGVLAPSPRPAPSRGGQPSKLWPLTETLAALAAHWDGDRELAEAVTEAGS